MNSYKRLTNFAGWLVFAIAATVYFFSVERTGSLWDCGEFVLGAYKLQVVHPPGAPLFLIVGRLFTYLAELFSNTDAHPENIAFSVNLMSGLSTAFAAMFIAWVTIILGKLAMVGRMEEPTRGQAIALCGAGIVAGLATAFTTSVWFSAVEGEVYAMSTFFTCLTLWASLKWYNLPNNPQHDRWLIFAAYAAGLSIGVHLLSILTFPSIALFYYFKKYQKHTVVGMGVAVAVGMVLFGAIQKIVITGIPNLWRSMELLTVNGLGLPFFSGLVPVILIISGLIIYGLYAAHNEKRPRVIYGVIAVVLVLLKLMANSDAVGLGKDILSLVTFLGAYFLLVEYLSKRDKGLLQNLVVAGSLVIVSFSIIGLVVIRANANPPINMNAPTDPMRLLPYLNREQYGERPLFYGPDFTSKPVDNKIEPRYGEVIENKNGKKVEKYGIVDEKISYVYGKKVLFPRMTDDTQNRPSKYRQWINKKSGDPTFFDNLKFLFRYQIGWMYGRYFMWNFAGRQNGEQGYYAWDKKSGNWLSGIKFLDEARLYNMDKLPEVMKKHKANNHYFLLPFLFGMLGMFFHFSKNRNDAIALMALFIITGIGIIIYSNQPPNEPRERDYVLVGSFFTFCIWIGMGALAVFEILRERVRLSSQMAAILGSIIVLSAPIIMGFQNFDDHSRRHHTAARDYASNFLESCEPNAILFTYGDNDTYPLWYAQEVEGIRTDVRVVNLSLIAVDWYIDQLRRKVNDSPAIKMTVPRDAYRGKKRNAVLYYNNSGQDREMPAKAFLKFIGGSHPLVGQGGRKIESYMPTRKVYLPVNKKRALQLGAITQADTGKVVQKIPIKLQGKSYLMKDELAILDVIASNIDERPVYFAVTCRPEKMFGMQDYMQLEGLGLRIIPVKSKGESNLFVYGSGRVSVDHVYDNVMNKFRWGNFDDEDLDQYIDRSYGPSIQSHRIVLLRTARELVRRGDKKRAIALVEKYFDVFPNNNFTYDWNAWQMINILLQAGAYEQAKPQIKILADVTADYLEFYFSLDADDLDSKTGSFGQDVALSLNIKDNILRAVKGQNDPDFLRELQDMFAPFNLEEIKNIN